MSDENTANTDLYNLRQRMQKNRESLQQTNNKYIEVMDKVDTLSSSVDTLLNKIDALELVQKQCSDKLVELETKPQLTFSDISTKISEWSSAELQPVLDELCDDMENALTEVKLVKQKQQQQLQQQISFAKVEEDAISVVDVRPSTAKPVVKPLQLQKKGTRL
jgi:predicted nuclease with TOPRIM domain